MRLGMMSKCATGNSLKLLNSEMSALSLNVKRYDLLVKYLMPHGFPLTNTLLLNYDVKQYIHCLKAWLCCVELWHLVINLITRCHNS